MANACRHVVLIKRAERLFNMVKYKGIRSDYYDKIVLKFPHLYRNKMNQDQLSKENQFVDNYSGLDMFIQMYRTKIMWSLMVVVQAAVFSTAILFALSFNTACAFQ